MGKDTNHGIFNAIKQHLRQNRLGDLLVHSGKINSVDLHKALKLQKESQKPLGSILVEQSMISQGQLRMVLGRQVMVRCAAAVLFAAVSVATFTSKRARADISDIPAPISLHVANFNQMASYTPLFGSDEKRSTDLKAFTKWSGVFDRFEREMRGSQNKQFVSLWHDKFGALKGMPLEQKVNAVNDIVNAENYIVDSKNWGKSDYWSTPVEFFARGGDCEDFAITKYVALRTLGVPEERLRLAVVHDNEKNIPHAILVVYGDNENFILDNQIKQVKNGERMYRYRPIFSINRTAWWLHTGGTTQLASR